MIPLETRTLEQCLACDSRRLERAAMRYQWQGGTFPMARCSDCGMLFLRVQPAGETLARMYSAEYFEQDFRCGRSDANSTDESAFRAENDGLLDRFERWRRRGRLLEVGSATGLLLKRARERGWQVTGVEISPDAVAHARTLGLDVHQGTIADAALAPDAFDVVYLGDVLEHVPDCRATLSEVVRVLSPGGNVVIRGPITTHSLARRLGLALYEGLGRDIVLSEPPYHLWEFRPASLARLARAVGLEVVAIEQSKISPGRPHGEKSALQSLVMRTLDTLNVPLTAAFNVLGDRVLLVARKPTPWAEPRPLLLTAREGA